MAYGGKGNCGGRGISHAAKDLGAVRLRRDSAVVVYGGGGRECDGRGGFFVQAGSGRIYGFERPIRDELVRNLGGCGNEFLSLDFEIWVDGLGLVIIPVIVAAAQSGFSVYVDDIAQAPAHAGRFDLFDELGVAFVANDVRCHDDE